MFLAGKYNVLADRISRLDMIDSAVEASYLLTGSNEGGLSRENHMSNEAFVYLQGRWIEGLSSCR